MESNLKNALRLCLAEIEQFHATAYPSCDGGCPAHEAMDAARKALGMEVLMDLKQFILEVVRDNSGGLKFSKLITEVVAGFYEKKYVHMDCPTPDEIYEEVQKLGLGILYYSMSGGTTPDLPSSMEKIFIYQKPDLETK